MHEEMRYVQFSILDIIAANILFNICYACCVCNIANLNLQLNCLPRAPDTKVHKGKGVVGVFYHITIVVSGNWLLKIFKPMVVKSTVLRTQSYLEILQ